MESPPGESGRQAPLASRVARVAAALAEHRIEFMVLGNAAAVLLGAPVTTADIDVFVRKTPANLRKLVACLRALGFDRTSRTRLEQSEVAEFERPNLKIDTVFSPFGIRSLASARSREIDLDIQGVAVPVVCLEAMIASKAAAAGLRTAKHSPFSGPRWLLGVHRARRSGSRGDAFGRCWDVTVHDGLSPGEWHGLNALCGVKKRGSASLRVKFAPFCLRTPSPKDMSWSQVTLSGRFRDRCLLFSR